MNIASRHCTSDVVVMLVGSSPYIAGCLSYPRRRVTANRTDRYSPRHQNEQTTAFSASVPYSLSGSVCYSHCPHSRRSRVYETVQCLSVCPINRQQQRCAVGLLLSAVPSGDIDRQRREPAPSTYDAEARRSAANAGSVTLTAEERG